MKNDLRLAPHESKGWTKATALGISDYLSCTGGQGGCPICTYSEAREQSLKRVVREGTKRTEYNTRYWAKKLASETTAKGASQ